jgi:hypothetical protein
MAFRYGWRWAPVRPTTIGLPANSYLFLIHMVGVRCKATCVIMPSAPVCNRKDAAV